MSELKSPEPGEIQTAREAAGHSQADAAEVVYVAARAWRMWEAGDRRMPLASWELYLIKTGQPELKVFPATKKLPESKTISDKTIAAYRMKNSGMTHKEIAGQLGLSVSRAAQMVRMGRIFEEHGEQRLKTESEFEGLEKKVIQTILRAGYSTKEQVKAGIKNNDPALLPRPKGTTPELGVKTRSRIIEWINSDPGA